MVKFITYQGEKYPIRISYYVLDMVAEELHLSPDEIEGNTKAEKDILWYALLAGHKMAKKDLTLKKDDMVWVLDECYLEFQEAILDFGQSIIDMKEKFVKKVEDKKKLTQ
jgi:hypothetical protein